MTNQNSWDHLTWSTLFKNASNRGYGFSELRIEVFENTLELVEEGSYFVDDIKKELHKSVLSEAEFYEQAIVLPKTDITTVKTQISVINADCLELAELLCKTGYNPCVLNMANRRNPGGGVFNGSGAQEENIFRRSNLHTALFQFVEYGKEYGIKLNPTYRYPLDKKHGAIYTPNITVFRGSEPNGYCLLKDQFNVAIITIPAINKPDLEVVNEKYRIAEEFIIPTKEKIRMMLGIAISKKHDSIILSAFGCGAFKNPPEHMAELFRDVFEEEAFKDKLKVIVFAIIDDHNTRRAHNPQGNILPFFRVFDQ